MSEEEYEKLICRMTQAIATDQFRRILAAGGMELPEGQDALAEKFARAAAQAIGLRPGMRVISEADYRRLVQAAAGDETILSCESCGAWLDQTEAASADEFIGCWYAATGREKDAHTCRAYRAVRDARPQLVTNGDPA